MEGVWPSVAVVVPNHSRITELEEAIESIEAQDYPGRIHVYLVYRPRPEIEPVLVRLGPAVTAIRSVDEIGRNSLATKRNLAITASTEDLIAFIDDDDLWHPQKLRAQAEVFAWGVEVVAVGSDMITFDGTPNWPDPVSGARILSVYRRSLGDSLCTSSLLMDGPTVRSLLMDERPYWLGVSDYHLKLRLGALGSLYRMDGALVAYRVGHDAMFAQDLRHNLALALSVLASYDEDRPVVRRLVALHVLWIAVYSHVGLGSVSDRAVTRLDEALNGRLFGPADRVLWRLVVVWWRLTYRWTGPRRIVRWVRRAALGRA